MSEPATKLERDIVFRKLRSKPENKVRLQLAGRWWSHAPYCHRIFNVRPNVCGRARHRPSGRAALLARVLIWVHSRRAVGSDGALVQYSDRCGPPGPSLPALCKPRYIGDRCTGAPCRFALTVRRRTRLGRPSLTACSFAWRARACTARSASTSALSGADWERPLQTCDCVCPELCVSCSIRSQPAKTITRAESQHLKAAHTDAGPQHWTHGQRTS